MRRQFRWLLAALLLVNLALAWFLLPGSPVDMSNRDAAVFVSFFLGGIPLLWADFNAIGWVGMWMGLRGLPQNRAALNTFVRVMAPPLLTVALFVFIAVNARPDRDAVWLFWSAWVALSLVSTSAAVRHRRPEVLRDFRRLAAGDKKRTAFDAFLPWVPGWRSDRSARNRTMVLPSRSMLSRPPGKEARSREGHASDRGKLL